MKRHMKTIIKLFAVIVITAIAFYFWKLAPVKVQTLEVKSSPIQQTVFGTGTLEGKTRLARSIGSRKIHAFDQFGVDTGTRFRKNHYRRRNRF